MMSSIFPKSAVASLAIFIVACLGVDRDAAAREPAKTAVLIGVSDYPKGTGVSPLTGPKNDVLLMWKLLKKRGFKVHVLADSLPKLSGDASIDDGLTPADLSKVAKPTFGEITKTVERVASQAGEKDQVIIYFAGHGSRQPEPDGPADGVANGDRDFEADGLDEIFLPIDIGKTDASTGTRARAIVDDWIRQQLDKIADKKAFVWAIFDACHAGGLRRSVLGNSGERFADTVLPSRVREKIRQKVAQRRAKIKKDAIVQHWVAKSKAGVVVFAAGTSSVKAQERPFVEEIFEDGTKKAAHGVFTYNLVSTLERGAYDSFRQLARGVVRRYGESNGRWPPPVFEGNLELSPRNMVGEPAMIAQKVQTHDGVQLRLNAGSLRGLNNDAVLELFPSVNADDAASPPSLGKVKVVKTQLSFSEVAPIDGTKLADLPAIARAQLLSNPVSFLLTIARPEPLAADATPWAKIAMKAVSDIETLADQNDWPVVFLDHKEAGASVRLHIEDGNLWLLGSDGLYEIEGRDRPPAIRVVDRGEDRVIDDLRNNIWRILRQRNIDRALNAVSQNPTAGSGKPAGSQTLKKVSPLPKFYVSAFLLRDETPAEEKAAKGEQRSCRSVPLRKVPRGRAQCIFTTDPDKDEQAACARQGVGDLPVSHCDAVYIEIGVEEANDAKPVDVTLLYLDSQYQIQAFSAGGRARIRPGQNRVVPIQIVTWCGKDMPWCVDAAPTGEPDAKKGKQLSVGIERLFVIGVEPPPSGAQISFNFLQQRSLAFAVARRDARTRGHGSTSGSLHDLLRKAGLLPRTRSANLVFDRLEKSAVYALRWHVLPPGSPVN